MGGACEALLIHGLRQGVGAGVEGDGCGGGCGGGWVAGTKASGGWVSGTGSPAGTASSGSSSSLFSSTSSLTDDEEEDGDGATSSPPGRHRVSSSSSSSLTSTESEAMQTDGAAAGGPLYELSPMMEHLPSLRTGLSKHYQGRSQSFTSLADVSSVEDLAKKTTPYIRRTKASRGCTAALGAKNRLSKTIAKKAQRGSPDCPLSRARSTSLLRGSGKPPAYQGKIEVYIC